MEKKVERAIELLNEYRSLAVEIGIKSEGLKEIDEHLESLEILQAQEQVYS